MTLFLALTIALSLVSQVLGHARLYTPVPDDYVASGSSNGAQSTSNCGHKPPLAWGSMKIGTLYPGYATLQIQELAQHTGPYRLCLVDANEVCRYVLADHIPQSSSGSMTYSITVLIPDVKCDATTKCKIQMIWLLTNNQECQYYDRNAIAGTGLPTGTTPKACSGYFHSCGSVTIAGAKTLDQIAPLTVNTAVTTATYYTPVDGQPAAWPYTPAKGYKLGLYNVGNTRESAAWGANGFLPSLAGTTLGTFYAVPNVPNTPTAPSTTGSPASTRPPVSTQAPFFTVNFPTVAPVTGGSPSQTSGSGSTTETQTMNSQSTGGLVAGLVLGILALFGVIIAMLYYRKPVARYMFEREGLIQKAGNNQEFKLQKYEMGTLEAQDNPDSWVRLAAYDGRIYWYNAETGQKSYTLPSCLEGSSDPSNAWGTYYTEEGRPYYYNSSTGESTYDRPVGV